MPKNELILLDATLTSMIDNAAFHAELANGHTLVAYARRDEADRVERLRVGDRVKVSLSPYDMSKGRILFDGLKRHESEKFSKADL